MHRIGLALLFAINQHRPSPTDWPAGRLARPLSSPGGTWATHSRRRRAGESRRRQVERSRTLPTTLRRTQIARAARLEFFLLSLPTSAGPLRVSQLAASKWRRAQLCQPNERKRAQNHRAHTPAKRPVHLRFNLRREAKLRLRSDWRQSSRSVACHSRAGPGPFLVAANCNCRPQVRPSESKRGPWRLLASDWRPGARPARSIFCQRGRSMEAARSV